MPKQYTYLATLLLATGLIIGGTPAATAQTNHSSRMQGLINHWVMRVENRVANIMDRYCDRFERYQERYGSSLPAFCENDSAPEPTPSPTPSPSPTSSPTSTPSPTVTPTPTPSPTATPTPDGNLYISEVFYDVDDDHGSESTNEWVEIYNDADTPADISGYLLEDASSSDTIPEDTVIPPNGYLVITNSASTNTFWSIPGSVPVIALEGPIGNQLGNSGDVLHLKDDSGVSLDSVNWGSNVSAFDPSAPDVAEGSSLARQNATTDTDTAADWTELTTPTPGQ